MNGITSTETDYLNLSMDSVRSKQVLVSKIFYFSLVILVAYYPFIISFCFKIWPPLTMFQEVFSANYTAFALTQKYQFIETGYGFLVLFDFPIAAIVDLFWPTLDNFNKFNLFSQLLYLYHGSILCVVYSLIYRAKFSYINKISLLFIPLAPLCLEKITAFNMIINYCKAEEIIYLIIAFLCIHKINDTRKTAYAVKASFSMGLLAGYIVSIKFSLLLVAVPTLYILVLMDTPNIKEITKNSLSFFLGSIVALTVILLCFNHFNIEYMQRFLHQTVQLYQGVWLKQSSPFLLYELAKLYQFSSYYFGLQLVLSLFALLFLATVTISFFNSNKNILLLGSFLLPIGTLSYMFWSRNSQGTMIDISLFCTFMITILSAMLDRITLKKISYFLVPLLALFFSVSAFSFEWPKLLKNLIKNSSVAKEFQSFIDLYPEFRTIYYMPGLIQSILFPGADLIWMYRGLGSQYSHEFSKTYIPRSQILDYNQMLSEPHIAIIPEYLEQLPKTYHNLKEWPNMLPIIRPLQENKKLFTEIMMRKSECRVFQFIALQDDKQLLYYSFYPTKVTACILITPKPHHPEPRKGKGPLEGGSSDDSTAFNIGDPSR